MVPSGENRAAIYKNKSCAKGIVKWVTVGSHVFDGFGIETVMSANASCFAIVRTDGFLAADQHVFVPFGLADHGYLHEFLDLDCDVILIVRQELVHMAGKNRSVYLGKELFVLVWIERLEILFLRAQAVVSHHHQRQRLCFYSATPPLVSN